MDKVKVYKVKYQILTPVHIGTGEDLTPFDYVIVNDTFHRIVSDELISSLTPEQLGKFYDFIKQSNITKLRDLIVENFNEEKFSKYKLKVFSGVAEKYKRNLKNINNQLLISPFIRTTDDFKPYIPGSSIKGAIRTAIIDDVVQKRKDYKPPANPGNNLWELEAMGAVSGKEGENKPDISKDPFRTLKVSDVFIKNDFMAVGEVLNVRVDEKRNRLTQIGIQMIKEVILGRINVGSIVEFEGEIRIDEFLPSIKKNKAISMPLTKELIIESCNKFYRDEFKREMEFYAFATDMHDVIDKMRVLFSLNQNECVIRVGRFSGVYAVTINKFRNPHNKKWGNTRNLFDGRYPMGWVKIKFIDEKKQEN